MKKKKFKSSINVSLFTIYQTRMWKTWVIWVVELFIILPIKVKGMIEFLFICHNLILFIFTIGESNNDKKKKKRLYARCITFTPNTSKWFCGYLILIITIDNRIQ